MLVYTGLEADTASLWADKTEGASGWAYVNTVHAKDVETKSILTIFNHSNMDFLIVFA